MSTNTELRALATRCIEGKWIDGDFTAAANPVAILELLDERDALLAALKSCKDRPADPEHVWKTTRDAIQQSEGGRNEQGA